MKNSPFKPQVDLLLEVLPFVSKEKCFALKGGTAINLFVRDLPRLSVDIDITYLGDEPRGAALILVEEALKRIKGEIETKVVGAKVLSSKKVGLDNDIKLFVSKGAHQIKIEASPVIRGTVLPVENRVLVSRAVEIFEVEVETPVVNLGDLYGGKLVAALDRQHPRDLFDVKLLFENEGLTQDIVNGFLTYLISHNRPFHEVLKPTLLDQRKAFESQFSGMTDVAFDYEDFEKTRIRLVKELNSSLTADHKEFLISFMTGEPKWDRISVQKVRDLPAVKWKFMNIEKMDKAKRSQMVELLKAVLE